MNVPRGIAVVPVLLDLRLCRVFPRLARYTVALVDDRGGRQWATSYVAFRWARQARAWVDMVAGDLNRPSSVHFAVRQLNVIKL